MNYWDKQKRLKEVYDRATNDSGVSWHEEYLNTKEWAEELEGDLDDCHKKFYQLAVKYNNVTDKLLEEKKQRFEVEEKYERLTRKIKENAVKEVSEREGSEVNIPVNEKYMTLLRQGTSISFPVCCSLEGIRSLKLTYEVQGEFGKLVQERLDDDEEPIKVNFGAGPREVQHIMKRRDYEKDI